MTQRPIDGGRYSQVGTLVLLAMAWMLVTGCDSKSDRRPISGMVSVDGKPVEKGSIMFLPDAGHRGPSASSSLIGGEYQFSTENGPTAGAHRVVIGVGLSSPSSNADAGNGPLSIEPTAPTSSTSAKQGPGESPSLTVKSGEPKPIAVNRTQWESTATVPAAEAADAAKPIDFSFQNREPVTGSATDTAP